MSKNLTTKKKKGTPENPYLIVIAGSRTWKGLSLIRRVMEKEIPTTRAIIVTGGAKGADRAAESIALEMKMEVRTYRPDYTMVEDPKIAPLVRNEQMARDGDRLIAFWDGITPGTGHMVSSMRRHKKPVIVINSEGRRKRYDWPEQELTRKEF